MPTIIRPWNPDSEAVDTSGLDPSPPNPRTSVPPEQDIVPLISTIEPVASNPAPKPTPLFRCQICHTTFLTETGLVAHHDFLSIHPLNALRFQMRFRRQVRSTELPESR